MNRRFFILPLLALLVLPLTTHAAVLSVSADATTVSTGQIFSATVYLNAQGDSINASDGTLAFPTSLVTAQSVAYGNSIFSLWAQEPTIDNTNGAVSWSGGSSSSYSGSHGRVVQVTFVAKKAGVVTFTLPSSSIYANDGLGTNVANAPTTASVTITGGAPTPVPVSTPAPTPKAPNAPVLSSPTNPDQEASYPISRPVLTWTNPPGTTEVETVVSQKVTTAPFVIYQPPITQKRLDTLPDGVWYFGVRARTSAGWSPVARYTLRVDTSLPEESTTTPEVATTTLATTTPVAPAVATSSPEVLTFTLPRTAVLMLLLAAALAFILIGLLGWYRFYQLKKKSRTGSTKIQKDLHRGMVLLKRELQSHLESLHDAGGRRRLTVLEENLSESLESDISDLERFIRNDLEQMGE